MRSILFLFDLAICLVWMLSVLGGRVNWANPTFPLAIMAVVYRIIASISLYYHKERRSWFPMLMVFPLTVIMFFSNVRYNRGEDILDCIMAHGGMECDTWLKLYVDCFVFAWLLVVPWAYYLFLLGINKLRRTELTWSDLLGGIFWHGRMEKTVSAIMMVMLVSFLAGLSMDARLCQFLCLTACPLTYWLVCRYYNVKAERLWLLVIGMALFWYGQLLAGVLRITVLLISFGLVACVGFQLWQTIRKSHIVAIMVLYIGILLPSISIGYNQYMCINYARCGFSSLSPFNGVMLITDSSYEYYGIRDRYGTLVEPEYEFIRPADRPRDVWRYIYELDKNLKISYYDVLNNTFITSY